MSTKDLKEAIEKNADRLTLNGQPVTKEELEKSVTESGQRKGESIRHEGNGAFRRKISG